MKMELRTTNQASLKSNGDLVVSGYVNKPGALSEILGTAKKFREKIAPGAFQKALENRSRDIDFLGEHDAKQLLASTRNDSLQLREDSNGLFMEATISNTTFGKDFYTLISEGLIKNMSFGFRALKDSWDYVEGMAVRTVLELELFEVSAVKEPAYTQSTIAARGIDLVENVEVPTEEEIRSKKSEYSDNKENEKRNNQVEKMIKMPNEQELRGLEKEQRGMEEFSKIVREGKEFRAVQLTSDGAPLIPENVSQSIILKMVEISPVFSKARKLTPVAGSIKVSRENDSVVAGFVGEGTNILEQAIAFEYVELQQKRVGAAISLSNQLVLDAGIDIASYVRDLLARRTVKAIEKSMLIGVGGTEFNGVINDADVRVINNDAAGAAVTIDNLLDLYNGVHPDFLPNSIYVMQRNFFNKVAKLKDSMGHYYMQNGVINGKLSYTLFGVPVTVTDVLPDATPAIFGDIEQAVSMLIKKDQGLQEIVDTTQALRGSRLYVFDMYADSAVVNSQAIVKLALI